MLNLKAISAFSALLLASAGSAHAGPWTNIYMVDTGGSRLWQTDDPAEASYVWATVTSPNGTVLSVQCPTSPGMTEIVIGQRGNIDGPNYLSNNSIVYFIVDNGTQHQAIDLHYSQSSYSMSVPNRLIREMANGKTLIMSYGASRSDKKIFSLRGSQTAISAIDCSRLD